MATSVERWREEALAEHRPWSLLVLEAAGERLTSMTFFLDVETLFPHFGLPAELSPAVP